MKKYYLFLCAFLFVFDTYSQVYKTIQEAEEGLEETFIQISKATSIKAKYDISIKSNHSDTVTNTSASYIKTPECSILIADDYETVITKSVYFKVIKSENKILYLQSSDKVKDQKNENQNPVNFIPLNQLGYTVDSIKSDLSINYIYFIKNNNIGEAMTIRVNEHNGLPLEIVNIYSDNQYLRIEFEELLINQLDNENCYTDNYFTEKNNSISLNPSYLNYRLIKL